MCLNVSLLVNMCEKFLQGRCWIFFFFFFLKRERNHGLKWQKGAKKSLAPLLVPELVNMEVCRVKSIVGYTEALGLDVLVLHQGDPYLWVPHYSQGEPP